MDHIAWLKELRASDDDHVGGKGANLGDLVGAGFAVPTGFVVTAESYREAMASAGVETALAARSAVGDDLAAVSQQLREMVHRAGLPASLREEIVTAYVALGEEVGLRDVPVAVRSSAVGEDAADASFAGMNRTLTNVKGGDDVASAVVECWGSLFGERAIVYRMAKGVAASPSIAVVVQAMVTATRSGVAFSVDPTGRRGDAVVIEASFGQGESVVSGAVEPDRYVVARDPFELVDVHIGNKAFEIVADAGGETRRSLADERRRARVLTDWLPTLRRAAAVLDAIRRIVTQCRTLGLTSSLCGQAPSNRPSFAEHLVHFGITSVSVNPDAIDRTRAVLVAAEQRILLKAALRAKTFEVDHAT